MNQTLWHPFADMSRVQGNEVVIRSGLGCWVKDIEGREYLDASAGLWYCNVGYGRTELAEAAAQQMSILPTYQLFDVFATEPALALSSRLTELASLASGTSAFFTCGGSDSIDSACKIARNYWDRLGEKGRTVFIAREGAYHGMHGFGTSLSGIDANSSGWGPLLPDIVNVPRHDIEALELAFEANHGRIAAFIGEPVQGASGVHPPRDGYWQSVQRLCDDSGALLISDEVVSGFGRVGHWFGYQRYGFQPDLVCCAKGLTSGYLPLGAVLATSRITDVLWSQSAGPFRHGYTYSGHATCCAVANANLDIIESESLGNRVIENEEYFKTRLAALDEHDLVREVRCAGFLCGIEISADESDIQRMAALIVEESRARGVLVRALTGRTIQISPPLTIGISEIDMISDVLKDSLNSAAAKQTK